MITFSFTVLASHGQCLVYVYAGAARAPLISGCDHTSGMKLGEKSKSRIQRRALANRYPVHVQENVTSKTMGHGRASVERDECGKRQVSAARDYGSSDGEDPGLGAYGISSYYSTLSVPPSVRIYP